jgi:hypothetical protein
MRTCLRTGAAIEFRYPHLGRRVPRFGGTCGDPGCGTGWWMRDRVRGLRGCLHPGRHRAPAGSSFGWNVTGTAGADFGRCSRQRRGDLGRPRWRRALGPASGPGCGCANAHVMMLTRRNCAAAQANGPRSGGRRHAADVARGAQTRGAAGLAGAIEAQGSNGSLRRNRVEVATDSCMEKSPGDAGQRGGDDTTLRRRKPTVGTVGTVALP